MNKILEINDLSISFATRDGSFKAVDNISFDIFSAVPVSLSTHNNPH